MQEQERNGEMEPDQLPERKAAQTSPVDESRRRFTKSGVAVSGLVFTLASRPVMGRGGHAGKPGKCCAAPSAWGSINTSSYGPEPVCQGKPPQYWKDCPDEWPVKCDRLEFHRYFMCGPNFKYYKATMLDVCANQYSDWFEGAELCSRLVAAYLNCKQGWTPFLKEETIKAIFSECFTKGTFSPTAGVTWTRAQCIEYLKATQEA
jgi:hypothetical protein